MWTKQKGYHLRSYSCVHPKRHCGLSLQLWNSALLSGTEIRRISRYDDVTRTQISSPEPKFKDGTPIIFSVCVHCTRQSIVLYTGVRIDWNCIYMFEFDELVFCDHLIFCFFPSFFCAPIDCKSHQCAIVHTAHVSDVCATDWTTTSLQKY